MLHLPPEGQQLLTRIQALVPHLAAEAAESERLRRPTDAAIRSSAPLGALLLLLLLLLLP
ncbi:MAG TPA: hypothetical protein VMS55_11260 [Myxococcota bacterium]|nr:hypothetical protein [Myxococcota bacterium]